MITFLVIWMLLNIVVMLLVDNPFQYPEGIAVTIVTIFWGSLFTLVLVAALLTVGLAEYIDERISRKKT